MLLFHKTKLPPFVGRPGCPEKKTIFFYFSFQRKISPKVLPKIILPLTKIPVSQRTFPFKILRVLRCLAWSLLIIDRIKIIIIKLKGRMSESTIIIIRLIILGFHRPKWLEASW